MYHLIRKDLFRFVLNFSTLQENFLNYLKFLCDVRWTKEGGSLARSTLCVARCLFAIYRDKKVKGAAAVPPRI